jgi:hypothetical protein
LISAANVRAKTRREADARFERVINVLGAFKNDFLSNDPVLDQKWDETVTRAIAKPKTNAKSRGLVDALKENLYPNVSLLVSVPLTANHSLANGKRTTRTNESR